jgi:hypothetical protein
MRDGEKTGVGNRNGAGIMAEMAIRFSITRLLGDPTPKDTREITAASVKAVPVDQTDERLRVLLAQAGIVQPAVADEDEPVDVDGAGAGTQTVTP